MAGSIGVGVDGGANRSPSGRKTPGPRSGLLSGWEAKGDVALGKRDLDAGRLERRVHGDGHLAVHRGPFLEVRRPGADLEVERAVAEALEEHDRTGVLQNSRHRRRRLAEQVDHALWIV